MNQKKFSIIIPTLDEENYIENLLSLFTLDLQEKYKFEIIISDGGSQDKTLEIARKYTHKIVSVERNVIQTIGEGRNLGANLSSADYLVFLNADTIPNEPAKFLETIYKWTNGKGKYKNYKALAGKVLPEKNGLKFKDKFYYFLFNKYFNFLNIINVGMGRGELQLVKKDLFMQLNGFNSKLAAGEDFDLFRRIAKIEKIKFANDLVVFESTRRFRKKGYLNTIFLWFINSIWVLFSNKSISKKWERVR